MDENQYEKRPHYRPGRIWAGLFIILVGGVLFLDQMGFPLPDWLFSWHILLIAIGLFLGLRHNFRGGAWLILILVGGIYLFQDYYPKTDVQRFIWPGVLIFIGLMIILRPKRSWNNAWRDDWERHKWEAKCMSGRGRQRRWERRFGPGGPGNEPQTGDPGGQTGRKSSPAFGAYYNWSDSKKFSSEDFIDTTSIFGGVHKKVVSKNFKGGDITTFLGGTEIDLSQADFNGIARLDVTQVMGGTKIIVPAHWEVRSEVTALFAGFEDKRQQPAILNPEKILIIDGTSIFGGIELKNF